MSQEIGTCLGQAAATWGTSIIKVRINVNIPEWPFWVVIQLVLLYRRLRYGYAFRKIRLSQGKHTIVDPEDYERLSYYNWYAAKSGTTFYAVASEKIDGKWKIVQMHRKIMEVGAGLLIDHINRNGLDNRKMNLRSATAMQNTWNRVKKRGRNKFRGVLWNKKKKKWQARLIHKHKSISLGYFHDEVEAARTYDEAAKKFRGEFAVLNLEGKE